MHLVYSNLLWVSLILLGAQTPANLGPLVRADSGAIEDLRHTQHQKHTDDLVLASSYSEAHAFGGDSNALPATIQEPENPNASAVSAALTETYSVKDHGGKDEHNPENGDTGSAIAAETGIEHGTEPRYVGSADIEDRDTEYDYEYEDQPTVLMSNEHPEAVAEESPTETHASDDANTQPAKPTPSAADLHQRDPKSLKNRFNYASADCAAVVLKANKEAKGLTTILNSKKDQYMLNECSARGKFVIVELCDDILIDTLVLGNYEFFSSTFKDTMVYVSDRYPPKNNTWTPLGHFQARNNRDAQVFPVHEPPIWAKYIKVDFISHYGNEHYCPLTVFKVYGTTQMEQYRKEEDEGDFADTATLTVDALVGSPLRDYQFGFPYKYQNQQHHPQQLRIGGSTGSPAKAYLRDMQGLVNKYEARDDDGELQEPVRQNPTIPKAPDLPWDRQGVSDKGNGKEKDIGNSNVVGEDGDGGDEYEYDEDEDEDEEDEDEDEDKADENADRNGGDIGAALDGNRHGQRIKEEMSGDSNKDNTGQKSQGYPSEGTDGNESGQPIQPHRQRGQESIFKTIMRRLLRVERNVTLAYRYLEEQHMVFNLVLQQVEHNNLENVQLAIKQLNHSTAKQMQSLTTLSEEIWRAILYDLEEYQQKTQSEMSKMAGRLEFLAEEVLFEKRMNVVQLGLLLAIVVMIAASKVVTKLALIPESKKEK
ncbi:hypothetical protein EV177_000952 [Coemansia sp. RSA 1804]|nr:hypothetical protein EV177_000952 [Coemansia sp. RSA 1804]